MNELTNEYNRRTAEYENKIAILKEENDRLNHNYRNTMTEADQLGRNMNSEIQKLISQNNHLQENLNNVGREN